MDEVKIIESSNSKSFPSHPQIETSSRVTSSRSSATSAASRARHYARHQKREDIRELERAQET
jgi:hypothetical protein